MSPAIQKPSPKVLSCLLLPGRAYHVALQAFERELRMGGTGESGPDPGLQRRPIVPPKWIMFGSPTGTKPAGVATTYGTRYLRTGGISVSEREETGAPS